MEDRILKEGRPSHVGRPAKYPPEFRERAIRMARESQRSIAAVAADLGINHETLRQWLRQDEADNGSRSDRLSSAERQELAALRRENRELRWVTGLGRLVVLAPPARPRRAPQASPAWGCVSRSGAGSSGARCARPRPRSCC